MSIREYQVGEHPAGFVGYRVTVTFGWDHLRTERYFSQKEHGSQAKILAEAEHAQLEALSQRITQEDRVYRKRHASPPNILADGFRAKILTSRHNGKDSFSFAFCVDNSTKKGSTRFPIAGDHDAAFRKALRFYAQDLNLSADEVAYIESKKPAPELFLQYLAPCLRESGHVLSDESVAQMTGAVKSKSLPTKADFDEVLHTVKSENLPIQVYFDKVIIFWRSRVDKCYYKEFLNSEWGGIHKSFLAARRQLQQFEASERAICLETQNEKQHPAHCVKLDHFSNRKRYRITVNGKNIRTISFQANESCADGQLHAYRTALTMAVHIIDDGYTSQDLDKLPDWRKFRIYENGMPALPYGFWQRNGTPDMTRDEVKKIIAKILKESGFESLLIDV